MEREFSIHPENPEEYLEAKLDTKEATPQEHMDWFNNAGFPLFEDMRQPRMAADGSISINQKYHDLKFQSFQRVISPEEEHPKKILRYIDEQEKNLKRKSTWPIGEFVWVESLRINNGEGRVLGLTDLLPSGHYYLLLNGRAGDNFDPINKVICVRGISSPDGIISLAHEAGHADIYESLDGDRRHALKSALERYRTHRGSYDDLATVLKHERDAWAWTLKKIRPIVGNNNGEGIITRVQLAGHIHKMALQSYGQKIAKEILRLVEVDKILES